MTFARDFRDQRSCACLRPRLNTGVNGDMRTAAVWFDGVFYTASEVRFDNMHNGGGNFPYMDGHVGWIKNIGTNAGTFGLVPASARSGNWSINR
jgi:prepilin-type processing-associated H-X9-DG protein